MCELCAEKPQDTFVLKETASVAFVVVFEAVLLILRPTLTILLHEMEIFT